MSEIEFHYIKSNGHQEIKVDGAIGGITPSGGGVAVSVFTERAPIPRTVVHQAKSVDAARTEAGAEIAERRDARNGIVRIVQATLHMDVRQARAFRDWLNERINELESTVEDKKDGVS